VTSTELPRIRRSTVCQSNRTGASHLESALGNEFLISTALSGIVTAGPLSSVPTTLQYPRPRIGHVSIAIVIGAVGGGADIGVAADTAITVDESLRSSRCIRGLGCNSSVTMTLYNEAKGSKP
jgi:hypothetical protein